MLRLSCKREAICGKSKNLGFLAEGLGGSVPCRPLVRYLHSVELLLAAAVLAEVAQVQPDEIVDSALIFGEMPRLAIV